jgi:hypothetical protein
MITPLRRHQHELPCALAFPEHLQVSINLLRITRRINLGVGRRSSLKVGSSRGKMAKRANLRRSSQRQFRWAFH